MQSVKEPIKTGTICGESVDTYSLRREPSCELFDKLDSWFQRNIEPYHNDISNIFLPRFVDDVKDRIVYGDLPKPEFLSGLKVKAGTWFNCLMRFHFAGRPTEQYSNEQLGITATDGLYGENIFYRDLFDKLRECRGARTIDDYTAFMDWLIRTDLLEDYPCHELVNQIPDGYKVMRPELCDTVLSSNQKALPFDPERPKYIPKCFIHAFPARFLEMKFYFIRTMLQEAHDDLKIAVIDKWLCSDSDKQIRDWLFLQRFYPLNTFLHECYPWNVVLEALTALIPEPLDTNDAELIKKMNSGNPVVSDDTGLRSFTIAFGRTIKSVSDNGNTYLKLQSRDESDFFFKRNYTRLQVFRNVADDLESETVHPEKLIKIECTQKFLSETSLESSEQEKILKTVKEKACLAIEFTTPKGKDYEEYNYDVKSAGEALNGIRIYARDYGRLWKKGLLGPVAINAFHHYSGGRRHMTLAPYIGRFCEGAIESWCFEATNHPNVGGEEIGMRDMGDTYTPNEITGPYFDDYCPDHSKSDTPKKIRLNELARAAESLVLLYARRFNKNFDYSLASSVGKISREVSDILSDLFSSAMPLAKDECLFLMCEHNLLEQCSREISYWLAANVPYVADLRAATINRAVYPLLPQRMRSCVLTGKQSKGLFDHGFVYEDRSQDSHCQLGALSGRMPVISLNGIITKLIEYGALEMIKIHRAQECKNAERLHMEKYVA